MWLLANREKIDDLPFLPTSLSDSAYRKQEVELNVVRVVDDTVNRFNRNPTRRVFLRSVGMPHKMLTWKMRPMPDFLVVGAAKSGTTSLHHYLRQHPQIFMTSPKELRYFSECNYGCGEAWYRSHFPLFRKNGSVVGEGTPSYFAFPKGAQNIHQDIPRVKLIAILRDPTKRAISHYFHSKRLNREPLSLKGALATEDIRIREALEAARKGHVLDHRSPHRMALMAHTYRYRGMYFERIQEYLSWFDRGQLLVVNSEQLFAQPYEVLEKVYRFLGVDDTHRIANLAPKNVGSNKQDVSQGIVECLNRYFAIPNQRLFDFLGEDYGWPTPRRLRTISF